MTIFPSRKPQVMRKTFSIIFNVIAGFFVYVVSFLAFINGPQTGMKWLVMAIFSIPGILALIGGLTLARFRNWRRDTGIVLLCGSGFTLFIVFSLTCYMMNDEFKALMTPETIHFFSDYLTGGGVVAGLGALGLGLLMYGREGTVKGGVLNGKSLSRHSTDEN